MKVSIDQQSADLATALQADQAVITEDGLHYVDNERTDEKVMPFSEVIDLSEADIVEESGDDNFKEGK